MHIKYLWCSSVLKRTWRTCYAVKHLVHNIRSSRKTQQAPFLLLPERKYFSWVLERSLESPYDGVYDSPYINNVKVRWHYFQGASNFYQSDALLEDACISKSHFLSLVSQKQLKQVNDKEINCCCYDVEKSTSRSGESTYWGNFKF